MAKKLFDFKIYIQDHGDMSVGVRPLNYETKMSLPVPEGFNDDEAREFFINTSEQIANVLGNSYKDDMPLLIRGFEIKNGVEEEDDLFRPIFK